MKQASRKVKKSDAMLQKEVDRAVNSALHRRSIAGHTLKYFDQHYSPFNSPATPSYATLSDIPQGITQSERIADTVHFVKVEVRYNVTTANADVYNLQRMIFFVWKQNNTSVTPGTGSIVEAYSTNGVFAPHNYEGRKYYTILSDVTNNLTGVATSPTNNSQQFHQFELQLNNRAAAFELGATTGTGLLYFLHYSDSAITPFPVVTMTTRTWYYDD